MFKNRSRCEWQVTRTIRGGARYEGRPGHIDLISGSLIPQLMAEAKNVDLANLQILGDVDLSHTEWTGRLLLENCRITGTVDLDSARLAGYFSLRNSHCAAVKAQNARVDGPLQLSGCEFEAGFLGVGLVVTGALYLREAKLGTVADRPNRAACELYRAEIGDVYMQSSELQGGLYAVGLTVRRNLRLQGATVKSRAALGLVVGPDTKHALALAGAEIGGSLNLWGSHAQDLTVIGSMDVRRTGCRNLVVSAEQCRKPWFSLDGLAYQELGPATPRDVLSHLEGMEPAPVQGYLLLAAHLQSDDADARRRVLWALQRRRAHASPFYTADGLRRRLYGALAGHGYKPGLAALWLCLVTGMMAALLFWRGQSVLVPADGTAPLPGGLPAALTEALVRAVPFAATGGSAAYTLVATDSLDAALVALLILLQITAWVLVALAAASVGRLVRPS